MYGPPIPPPTAVYADYLNQSLEVHWGKPRNVTSAYSFEVLVSPSHQLSEGCNSSPCAFCMPVKQSPLSINRTEILASFDKTAECKDSEFQVAVSTILKRE